jgi:NAD(P)-dependent dehydrogenase (short-subunit alcohol dehydrogenase family)
MRLDGKVAIVTGSGRGLGRGIAQAMADAGAKVVVNARTPEGTGAVAAELADAGHDAIGVAADVSSSSDVARLFAQTVEHFGTVDILVNNAAITPSSGASRKARAEFL